MVRVHADIGIENYKVRIQAGSHQLTADEPPALGGANAGPGPYDLAPPQQARLIEIAEKTPVTLTLKRGIEIRTTLRPAGHA